MTQASVDSLAVALVIGALFPSAESVPVDLMEFGRNTWVAAGGKEGVAAIDPDLLDARIIEVVRQMAFPNQPSVVVQLEKLRAQYAVLNFEHQVLRAAAQRVVSEMPITPSASPALIALGGHAYRPSAA